MNSFLASWIPFYTLFNLRFGTEKTVDLDKPQIAQISEMTEAKKFRCSTAKIRPVQIRQKNGVI
jgi:hypothetical protein